MSGRRGRRYRRSNSAKLAHSDVSEEVSLEESFSGGYDFDFIENPSEELTCSVCLLVLRDPQLTSCCGNHFCQSCIEKIKDCCPLCKDTSFTTFLNKSFQRKVNELKIKCPLSENGCSWTGTVGGAADHLDPSSGDCEYMDVTCSLCGEDVQRKCLVNHMKDECLKRPFSCEHCGYSDTWVEVTSTHSKTCMNYPLPCPNMCGIGKVERKHLNIHINTVCPLQIEPCALEFAGCSAEVTRKDRADHMATDVAAHVTLLAGVCAEYKSKLDAKQVEIKELLATVESYKEVVKAHETVIHGLNQKISQLQVLQQGGAASASDEIPIFLPIDFYLLDFLYLKQANKKWCSKPFYTHPGGYKMCLNVYTNGIGKGRNSHISVFANLMKGDHDGDLLWPFQGYVVVSMELQDPDDDDDIVKTLVFGPKSPSKATQRVTQGDMNEFGQGEAQFVHYSKIASMDSLHFRIHRVNWKPV